MTMDTFCESSGRVMVEHSIPLDRDLLEYTFRKDVQYDDATKVAIDMRFMHSLSDLRGKKTLVAGAGTIGNEIVKDLVMSGVSDITIVDMDTYETYNLPRSTLVRADDIGCYKAEALARRGAELSPFPIVCRGIVSDISRLGYGFMEGFDVVLSPGDSWSMRSFVSRGARLMDVPHISCGTSSLNHLGGMMTGTVTMEPSGCEPCYECLAPGTLRDQEVKLSCANYVKEVQAQVIPFSSVMAGFASLAAIHTLEGRFPRRRSEGPVKALAYAVNETGFENTEVAMPMTMTHPDPRCGFHRLLDRCVNDEMIRIVAHRTDTVRDLWRGIVEATGVDTVFGIDFATDRLFYLAFPERCEGDQKPIPPIAGLQLDDRDDEENDVLAIARMPRDHVYFVYDACDSDQRCWKVRLVFEGDRDEERLRRVRLRGLPDVLPHRGDDEARLLHDEEQVVPLREGA